MLCGRDVAFELCGLCFESLELDQPRSGVLPKTDHVGQGVAVALAELTEAPEPSPDLFESLWIVEKPLRPAESFRGRVDQLLPRRGEPLSEGGQRWTVREL